MKYKHLPHLDLINHYQFITFRTADSAEDFFQRLSRKNKSNSEIQLAIDKHLDGSTKGAYLEDEVLHYLYQFLIEKNDLFYELVAFAVMSNHVHLLVRPLLPLAKMMQSLKGMTAKEINRFRGTKGKFWAKDYYDRTIRNEKHFSIVYEYIKRNPLNIVDSKMSIGPRFYGIYDERVEI